MVWYEIGLLILVGALLVPIFVIYYKHVPQIIAINTRELQEEKQQQVKVIMAEQRIGRRVKAIFSFLKKSFKPFLSLIKTMTSSWQQRIAALEERYKIERLTTKSVTEQGKESIELKVEKLIQQANSYANQEDYTKAEEFFINVIKLDPQSLDAFEGLGEVYTEQKKFEEAVEVYSYVLKFIQDQDESDLHLAAILEAPVEQRHLLVLAKRAKVLYGLSEVYKAQGLNPQAVKTLKEALKYEKNNPKYLDALLDISIIKKDKKLSHDTFLRLKEVNPDNKKLDEFSKKLEEL